MRLAAFPWVDWNPYQRLLYGHLAEHGWDVDPDARFTIGWLARGRHDVSLLHFHWPEGQYTAGRGPARLRSPLSWLKLSLFGIRLAVARSLGYRIVWTVHQVYPHERSSPARDRAGAWALARAAHVLIAHDASTARAAAETLRLAPERVAVVRHGSYAGAYARVRRREDVRAELGLDGSFAFLLFGELRGYKNLELALRAFEAVSLPHAALVVAGYPKDRAIAEAWQSAAASDPRIHLRLRFVPDDAVADLFAACDAAVVARSDGGTSGSLILALSLGLPVVAPDLEAYRELVGDDSGWLFAPGDAASLCAALEQAVEGGDCAARAAAARARVAALDWPQIAAETAALFDRGRS